MDPFYMAGIGQPGVTRFNGIHDAVQIQKELMLHWNYGIVLPNSAGAFNGVDSTGAPSFVGLANAYPQATLDIITFWLGVSPHEAGFPSRGAMILTAPPDTKHAITFDFYGQTKTEIKFNFPDSLARVDGLTQKHYLEHIMKFLKRPINRISENGEEPPGPYLLEAVKSDPASIQMKDSMHIDSWSEFMAVRKLQLRKAYVSPFLEGLPGLKNTKFSFYTVEGGPVDRFKWQVMKEIQTPLNGMHYSTPDFYPRWPANWKDWKGPWHGWKWIEIGRKTEIADGDKLFSPFVAAGWSGNAVDDIRPGQWLGLLKCLGTIGAEFYYVCYFNLGAPFPDPGQYTWQAAMPAYAQAITSRYEDVLRDGNVLFDSKSEPVISYTTSDKHVLITARKHSKLEKYVICGTYQPFSNDRKDIPEKKNVSISIDGHDLSFIVRRQGSVYIYEKAKDGSFIFYQLDGWHENAHPEYWTQDVCLEAELADYGLSTDEIHTETAGSPGDYTQFTAYVSASHSKEYSSRFELRDTVQANYFIWVRYKGQGSVSFGLDDKTQKKTLPSSKEWMWCRMSGIQGGVIGRESVLKWKVTEGAVAIDKFLITRSTQVP
jgi:hypothetical protein